MPRNIEYQLERYLKEENVLKFFLLCATDLNLYQPKNIRDKYDFHYGDVNFYYKEECNAFIERIDAKKRLLNNKDAIQKSIDDRYDYQKQYYQQCLKSYEEEDAKIDRVQARINELVPKNELQRLFLSAIQDYINEHKKYVIANRYKEPVKWNIEELRAELANELKDAQVEIKRLEFSKLFDQNQTFWDEIDEDWLSKMQENSNSKKD